MNRRSSTTVSHSESDGSEGLLEKIRYWAPVLTFVIASVSLTFTATWLVRGKVADWDERLTEVEERLTGMVQRIHDRMDYWENRERELRGLALPRLEEITQPPAPPES